MRTGCPERRRAIVAALCCVVPLLPAVLRAQGGGGWVPFVAAQVATTYDISGGQRRLVNKSIGPFVRDADGSIYSRTVAVMGPGSGQAGPATLQDRKTGITYRINYSGREAAIASQPPSREGWVRPSPPTAESWAAQHSPELYLGTKIVNGIELQGWRARPSADGSLTGEWWNAASLNYYPVVSKIVDSRHQVEFDFTLENIQVGQAPDPILFKVPAGFTVVKK